MASHRRLAAIMFSDIAGYTAMMQRNESDGLQRVKRYRQVLSASTAAHGGEILQHYGDGSLCIFHSAIEAVTCAERIQRELREAPEVPVRIGIHLGDIVVEGQDIYGDGVNLASRVQSLAVPGGILFTERVLPDVRSHPGFRTIHLGRFLFKNVSQPIDVYALANEGLPVPTRSEVRRRLLAASATDYGRAPRRRLLLPLAAVGGILLLALVVGLIIFSMQGPASGLESQMLPPPPPPSPPVPGQLSLTQGKAIAVLPFEDMSQGKDQQYLGDGIAEEIINTLSQVPGLRVAGRTSSFVFRNHATDPGAIGDSLGVGFILDGSVRKRANGSKVRIVVQLISAEDNMQRWTADWELEPDDIFAIQDTIARAVVQKVTGILLPEGGVVAGRLPTSNQEAYDLYLRGKYLLSQRSDGAERAIEFFEKAVKLDPKFAQAHAGLAHSYLWLAWGSFAPSGEAFPEARRHAEEALHWSPRLGYAHAILGSVRLWYDWDWAAARRSLEQAISLNANEAGAYLDLGWLNMIANKPEEAIRQVEKAVALDPLNLEYNIDLADISRLMRRYDKARSTATAMLSLYPDNSDIPWILGMIDYNEGRFGSAEEQFRKSVDLSGGDMWSLIHLAMAQARNGKIQEANLTLDRVKDDRPKELAPVELAMAYLALGDRDEALDLLEKGLKIKANWMISIRADAVWDELRGERRFRELVREMRFP